MPALSASLKKLLCHTKLIVLPEDYFVVHLPVDSKAVLGEWYRPATTRFAVFIREPQEMTLVMTRRKWLRMQSIYPKYELSGPMKVISFDVKLSQVAIGYMSAIGNVLTDHNLSVTPISSFRRDHILVPKGELPKTVKVLRHFLGSCRKDSTRKRSK